MKKWFLVFFCLKGALGLWWISVYFFSINQEREHIRQNHAKMYVEAVEKATDASHDIWHRLSTARTLEQWEELAQTDISALPEMEQQNVHVIIKSKLFEMLFWRAETLLARARGLLEQDENNTVAGAYLKEAQAIYERVKGFMPVVGATKEDSSWNAMLHYLQGVYYARSLYFIKNKLEKSKIEDAVAQAVASFDKVLAYAPKDYDTQVAIEVLQKKAKDLSSSMGSGDTMKSQLQLLPGKDKEIGSFQIGPRDEGKH